MHSLLDVGTGSGCIGITAKLEFPSLQVTLSDISTHALRLAEENATNLHATVSTQRSDLLQAIPGKFDYIVANLPYVDETWERSPETIHEPALALFADRQGLALIYRLLDEATDVLTPEGILLLEADPEQHAAIITYAAQQGFIHLKSDAYYLVLSQKA